MRILMGLLLLALPGACAHAALTASGVAVLDTMGQQRNSFSDNERIVIQQKVHNATAGPSRISFRFVILSPQSAKVFEHTGNSVPGNAGYAAGTVSGILIKNFFAGSGTYTLQASASMGAETLQQAPLTFAISSSFIILTYPPNGSRDLPENPPTFQWASSGAARYRISVSRDPSFADSSSPFTDTVAGASYTYPQNPPDLQKLTAGTIYYWKVEGLDAAGNVAAKSDPPYNFTLSASLQVRDLAVTSLEALSVDAGGAGRAQSVLFKITILNQGNTSEGNVPLRFSLGGLPAPGTPIPMAALAVKEERSYEVSAPFPSDQKNSLAIACLEIFDNNIPNNCKTAAVSRPPVPEEIGGAIDPNCRMTTCDQVWNAVKDALRAYGDQCGGLEGYQCISLEEPVSCQEVASLAESLRRGDANCSLSGPPPIVVQPTQPQAPVLAEQPSIPAAPSQQECKVTGCGQIWDAIKDALRAYGSKCGDYEEYVCTGFEGELTCDDLSDLVAEIRNGRADCTYSGPPPSGLPPPPPHVDVSELPPPPPVLTTEAEREWSGLALPLGDATATRAVSDEAGFKRLWKWLREEDVPEVDFEKWMVVAVMAGKDDRADRIEIEGISSDLGGLLVRYRLVVHERLVAPLGAERAAARSRTPYFLKCIPKSGMKVRFEAVEEEQAEERGKPDKKEKKGKKEKTD